MIYNNFVPIARYFKFNDKFSCVYPLRYVVMFLYVVKNRSWEQLEYTCGTGRENWSRRGQLGNPVNVRGRFAWRADGQSLSNRGHFYTIRCPVWGMGRGESVGSDDVSARLTAVRFGCGAARYCYSRLPHAPARLSLARRRVTPRLFFIVRYHKGCGPLM
jgi:hypothetical protein